MGFEQKICLVAQIFIKLLANIKIETAWQMRRHS